MQTKWINYLPWKQPGVRPFQLHVHVELRRPTALEFSISSQIIYGYSLPWACLLALEQTPKNHVGVHQFVHKWHIQSTTEQISNWMTERRKGHAWIFRSFNGSITSTPKHVCLEGEGTKSLKSLYGCAERETNRHMVIELSSKRPQTARRFHVCLIFCKRFQWPKTKKHD